MPEIRFEIEGGEALRRKLRDQNFVKGPLRDTLKRSAFAVEGTAKEFAPVDRGWFKASIKSEVSDTRAIVGSNVSYAPHIEYGQPPGTVVSHQDIYDWLTRKTRGRARSDIASRRDNTLTRGNSAASVRERHRAAALIVRAIRRRGTQPQFVFTRALKENVDNIRGFVRDLARSIETEWRR